jgi:uncharacterized SAM-binding protein YcdF (DUF218 family)
MTNDIFRLLQQWLQPLSILWLMMSAAVVWNGWRRRWRLFLGCLLPWTVLTLFACTPLPTTLLSPPERPWEAQARAPIPACDAVVCLGGGAEPSRVEPTGFHLVDSADRVTSALGAVSHAGARELVLGGGSYKQNGIWVSEADAVKRWLDTSKLSPVPVTSLGGCANTFDEATKVARLCGERGWRQVLLVTSASHMKRAEATFRKAGITVVCLPCNFHSSQVRKDDDRFVIWHAPHLHTLKLFQIWWHEFAGWHVYKRRGWL